MLITDLNDRERKKYADQIDSHIVAMAKVAEALRSSDDAMAAINLVIACMSASFYPELMSIFESSVIAKIPDTLS